MMKFRAPDFPVLFQQPDAVLCYLRYPSASARISLDGWVYGGLEEATGVSVADYLPVMVTARP